MLTSETDIGKFAQKLVRVGREEVAWENRKLQWIIERKKEAVKTDESD